jgi:phage regulator Rha-like protein
MAALGLKDAWPDAGFPRKVRDGKPMVSSLRVAELYERQHKHVLGAIQGLVASEEFNRTNFRPIEMIAPLASLS